jgi:hypothetical protein
MILELAAILQKRPERQGFLASLLGLAIALSIGLFMNTSSIDVDSIRTFIEVAHVNLNGFSTTIQ